MSQDQKPVDSDEETRDGGDILEVEDAATAERPAKKPKTDKVRKRIVKEGMRSVTFHLPAGMNMTAWALGQHRLTYHVDRSEKLAEFLDALSGRIRASLRGPIQRVSVSDCTHPEETLIRGTGKGVPYCAACRTPRPELQKQSP